ncbi:MAG: glycosyltransferase family 4 protein [Sandaracinus sp.]
MRLAFVSGRMLSIEGDVVHADAGVGRLVDALSDRVDEITVVMSRALDRRDSHDHRLKIPASRVVALPHMPSAVSAMRHGRVCRTTIGRVERATDVTVLQLPFAPPWALAPTTHPRVYHACADVVEVLKANRHRRGLVRVAAGTMARAMDGWQRVLGRLPHARVVANGDALARKMGGKPVVSTTMLEADLLSVPRRRATRAPRILFVGYLRPEKGLDVLVDAYRLLLTTHPDAELVIVGSQDLQDGGGVRELREALERLGSRGRVETRGQIPFGPVLFQEFADADLLVVPSRSEGTPRVLVEARALGCPVVASRVGGIPTSITDGVDGLLVPSDDAPALRTAIARVLDDAPLRARLVEAGLARARTRTVEAFAEMLLGECRALLETR